MTASEPLPAAAPAGGADQEAGLWLWRGAAPPALDEATAPPPRAAAPAAAARSRIEKTVQRLGLAAQSARWLALPGGLTVVGLAALAMVQFLTTARPAIPRSEAAVAPAASAMPSPIVPPAAAMVSPTIPPAAAASPVAAASPAAPSAAPQPPPALASATAEPEPAPAPQALLGPSMAGGAERRAAKSRLSHRVRHAVRRAHAAYPRRWAWEACRYQCDWQQPMSWHGGGY